MVTPPQGLYIYIYIIAWLVQNKGTPKSKKKRELILGKKRDPILWMGEIHSHHFETMVETIRFVGIYVGESKHSRAS